MMEVIWQVLIGVLGVVVTVLLPLLAVLNRHSERLAAIEAEVRSIAENWRRCNLEDRAQHTEIFHRLDEHGELIANHSARLTRIEGDIS